MSVVAPLDHLANVAHLARCWAVQEVERLCGPPHYFEDACHAAAVLFVCDAIGLLGGDTDTEAETDRARLMHIVETGP